MARTTTATAEREIAKLTVCYALATDAIGRGDLAQGRERYRRCFTADAAIAVFFPNAANDFTGSPDTVKTGPDEWTEFVVSVFRNNQYTATQHLIGSINIEAHERTARMTSYLHATHKRSDSSIDVANGTYEDDVALEAGMWKIRRRTLKLITFLNLASPASGTQRV